MQLIITISIPVKTLSIDSSLDVSTLQKVILLQMC